MTITAALIGDHFVRADIMERAFRKYLEPVLGSFRVRTLELGYPHEAQKNDAEIREYVGTVEDVIEAAADAEIVLAHMPQLRRAALERLPRLRAIGCTRTEPVNVNVTAATELGIPVVFAPARNARAVAEFTVGLIIAEIRNIGRGHAALAQGVWRSDLYLHGTARHELRGRTVGLIGFGNIGKLLPGFLQPFGMRVLAYDPYVPDMEFDGRGVERFTDLSSMLAECDIVSLHARVTPETRGFIGEAQFRAMKPGAFFFNTARGPMVDYDALYRALADGHLGGAGLETFAAEPPPSDLPLLRLPNVTLTPHIAGCSVESVENAALFASAGLASLYAGETPAHCSNPETLAAWRRG